MRRFDVGGSIKPQRIDEEDFPIGDNRRLYVRSSYAGEGWVEVQFDNGPRITVDAECLTELIKRCS